MRKLLLVVVGSTFVLLLATAPAARAADFPPTTVSALGSTVVASRGPGTAAGGNSVGAAGANTRLPHTGSDSGVVIWVGLALLGSGAFAVATFRRRARAS